MITAALAIRWVVAIGFALAIATTVRDEITVPLLENAASVLEIVTNR